MFASIMTKSLADAVRNAVAKYKAQRVKAVIAEYASYTHVHAATVIPLALHFYEDASSFVVDRTFEDPQPLVHNQKSHLPYCLHRYLHILRILAGDIFHLNRVSNLYYSH
jgi:hypothetical protein